MKKAFKPVRNFIVEQIFKENALLDYLTKKG